jgi:hypothetical protein
MAEANHQIKGVTTVFKYIGYRLYGTYAHEVEEE